MKHAQAMTALAALAVLAWAPNLVHLYLLGEDGDGQADVSMKLARVVDADTLGGAVVIAADKGEPLPWDLESDARPIKITLAASRVRVIGVDAYELKDPTGRGKKAREAVVTLLTGYKRIELTPKGRDNFGRLLAIVTIVTADDKRIVLADWLIEHKHGVPYRR